MPDKVKISIIIPVYNTGKELRRCLDSILVSQCSSDDQDFNDYEVIVINDGSTDALTLDILEEYKSNDKVKIYSISNCGTLNARVYGFKKASGNYIAYGDADDLFDKTYIDTVNKLIENDADIYILNNYLCETGTNKVVKEKVFKNTGYCSINEIREQLLKMKMGAVWDKIYLKSILEKSIDLPVQKIIYGEDIYINIAYLQNVTRAFISDEAIFYHFLNSRTSVCNRKADLNRLDDADKVFTFVENTILSSTRSNSALPYFEDFYYGYFSRDLIDLCREGINKKTLCKDIADKNILKKISIFRARTFKGLLYRIFLKFRLYKLINCTK